MKLILDSKNLNQPAISSLKLYSQNKFSNLIKKLKLNQEEIPILKINFEYNRRKKEFSIKIILSVKGRQYIFQMREHDPRRAIDIAVDNIKGQISSHKGKSWLNYH